MAITGIDTIEGKQIIAAGAVSAKSAEMAYNDENGNPITGYLTAVPEGYATTGDLTAYQTTAGMTAYQSAGDYLSANALDNVSGDWNRISALSGYSANGWKVSPTAGKQVFAQKITFSPQARQNIAAYLGIYSPGANSARNPYTYITDGSIYFYNSNRNPSVQFIRPDTIFKWNNYDSGKLNTTASANFYTTANESGFITAVPDTYLQNTDLSTEDGKVTAISGIPLSAGGDVPEGVMVESGLEYNAVNEISAYNGSAIAQYGAEKQWLVHDDTLVHAANSAQYALGVNLSAVAQLLGVDETVLYSGTQTYSAVLSESVKNFDKILIEYGPNNYSNVPAVTFFTDKFVDNNAIGGVHLEFVEHNGTNAYCFPKTTTFVWHNNCTNLDAIGGLQYRVSGNAIQNEVTGNQLYIRKIIGIGRKA